MNQFFILKDTTLSFEEDEGKNLFLMLIRIGDEYGIEINSRDVFVGRKMFKSKIKAQMILAQIEKRMKTYKCIHKAFTVLDLSFSLKEIPFMFLINILNHEWSYGCILKLKRMYSLQTIPIWTDLIFKDSSYNRSIEIFFAGYSDSLGKFISLGEGKPFIFELNPVFLTV